MSSTFSPLRIESIIHEDIGTPRSDGRYLVPLKLSATAPREWSEIFIASYDAAEQEDAAHPRGTVAVNGNRIVFDATTVDEIDRTHKHTLKLAVAGANREYSTLLARRASDATAAQNFIDEHKRSTSAAAKKVSFD